MQVAFQFPPNQPDLGHRDGKDIAGLEGFYHTVYNPNLITQLDLCRFDLDWEYFALLDAIDNKHQLKIRKLFAQFDDTLSKYLNKNRIELYGYLEVLYINDKENLIVIEANKEALNIVIYTITATLVKYASRSAIYDKKFRRELHSIWTLVKWRYYREKKLLYPLYRRILEHA